MSPPSIDGWLTEADEEEEDEEGAAADAEGDSLEEDDVDFDDGEDYPEDDDYDSETDISESGSSDRPMPGAYYSWPDPFDAGTEASCSTPRTGRSLTASPNQTARNSISSPANCTGLHDGTTAKADGATVTSSSGPAEASCAAGQGGMGEDDDDDEAAGFFISAGGALAGDEGEVEGADTAGSHSDGPSSLLQAYVAATGDLLKSAPSAASNVQDAKARQIQRVFRASQSRSQSKEVAECTAGTALEEGRIAATPEADLKSTPMDCGEPEVCIEGPVCQEPECPEKAANQLEEKREDQGSGEPSMERASPTQPQVAAYGRHSTEEVLRAQILAKQILVPVMLNAVFAVEAQQAAAAGNAVPSATSEGDVGEVAAARSSPVEEQKSQAATPHQSPTAVGEAKNTSQAQREQDVTLRNKEADAASAAPTAPSVAVAAHADEMKAASQPQLPAGEAPHCISGSKTSSSSAGSSAPLKRQCSTEVEGRRSGRTASTGKGSTMANGTAASEKGTTSRAPGRRLICTRGRAPQATRPRQPPFRLDRKPPVPRAQRSTSSRGSTLERAAAASSASEVRPSEIVGLAGDPGAMQGGSSASTCCTPTRRQPEAVAAGTGPADDACTAEELPCYEVSEEEFNRLVHFGLLGSPAVTEAAGAEAERYEISEEEFERLLSAGQLHVLPQEDTSGIAPEMGGEVPEAATLFCDVSEAQFEQLAKAGMLHSDAAVVSSSNEASAAGLLWPSEAGAGAANAGVAAEKPLTAPTRGSSSSGSKPDIDFAMGFDIHGFGIALPNGRVAAGSGCYSARYLRDLRAAEANGGGYVMKRYAGLL